MSETTATATATLTAPEFETLAVASADLTPGSWYRKDAPKSVQVFLGKDSGKTTVALGNVAVAYPTLPDWYNVNGEDASPLAFTIKDGMVEYTDPIANAVHGALCEQVKAKTLARYRVKVPANARYATAEDAKGALTIETPDTLPADWQAWLAFAGESGAFAKQSKDYSDMLTAIAKVLESKGISPAGAANTIGFFQSAGIFSLRLVTERLVTFPSKVALSSKQRDESRTKVLERVSTAAEALAESYPAGYALLQQVLASVTKALAAPTDKAAFTLD
jgi:hypothetical protein